MATSPQSTRMAIEPIRSLAFGSISGTYAAVGSALDNGARLVVLTNATNAALFISDNGVDDKVYLGAGASLNIYVTPCKSQNQGMYIAEGTVFYVRQVSGAPGSGSMYVMSFYGQ